MDLIEPWLLILFPIAQLNNSKGIRIVDEVELI